MKNENTEPVKTVKKTTRKSKTTPSPEKTKTAPNSPLTEDQIKEERIKALDEAYKLNGQFLPPRKQ